MFKKEAFLIFLQNKSQTPFQHISPFARSTAYNHKVFTSVVQFWCQIQTPQKSCSVHWRRRKLSRPLLEPPEPTRTPPPPNLNKIIFSAKKKMTGKKRKRGQIYIRILFTTCYTMHNAVQKAHTHAHAHVCTHNNKGTLHSKKQSNKLYMCLCTWIGGHNREVLTCMAWREEKFFFFFMFLQVKYWTD